MNATIIRDVLLAVALEAVSLALTPLVPLAPLFRRYVRTDRIEVWGEGGRGEMIVERYRLPRWLAWYETPDELLPGGMYEPTVRGWYQSAGPYACSVLWLLRNRLYGLAWRFGRPAGGYLDPIPGAVATRGDLWRWWRSVGPIVLQAGWKVHRKTYSAHWADGPLWAVPFVSVRLRRNS